MPSLKIFQKIALVTTLLAMSACSQNPQFKINSANQVYGSLNELQILLASAELGALKNPSSFQKQVDSYAKVIGGFEVGRQSAVVSSRIKRASKISAMDALDNDISNCIADLQQMARQHKTSGIAPDAAIIQTVRTNCNAAARTVAANENAALIIQSAEGGL